MRGLRHSGVRIIVPPGRTCEPTRVTCKLVRTEKVDSPPPLTDGEALASRILKMGPVGAKFTGSVIHSYSFNDKKVDKTQPYKIKIKSIIAYADNKF